MVIIYESFTVTTQKVEAHSGENIDCLIKLLLNSSCKGGII